MDNANERFKELSLKLEAAAERGDGAEIKRIFREEIGTQDQELIQPLGECAMYRGIEAEDLDLLLFLGL